MEMQEDSIAGNTFALHMAILGSFLSIASGLSSAARNCL